MTVTKDSYFVGVYRQMPSGRASVPRDPDMIRVLKALGCADVQPVGSGTAAAQVPVEWADGIAAGNFSRTCVIGKMVWVVDVDLP